MRKKVYNVYKERGIQNKNIKETETKQKRTRK